MNDKLWHKLNYSTGFSDQAITENNDQCYAPSRWTRNVNKSRQCWKHTKTNRKRTRMTFKWQLKLTAQINAKKITVRRARRSASRSLNGKLEKWSRFGPATAVAAAVVVVVVVASDVALLSDGWTPSLSVCCNHIACLIKFWQWWSVCLSVIWLSLRVSIFVLLCCMFLCVYVFC